MGSVWAAVHIESGEPVALKLLKRGAEAVRAHKRVLREARAIQSLEHPHVRAVREVIEDEDGTPTLVMDLLEGESLAERLRRSGSVRLTEACGVLVCVASAVGAAHARGIVHRDLKPENIFLAGPEGTVKVLDFGIAKWSGVGSADQDSATTASGAILGTPAYMAPEQVFGEHDVDHRADIWALGLVLYECLSGHLPTRADNVGQILKNIVAKQIPPLSARGVDAPAEIVSLIERMLSRDRKKRPASLSQVTAVLERHTPVRAPRFEEPREAAAVACEETTSARELGPGDATMPSRELEALVPRGRRSTLRRSLWAGGALIMAGALSWGLVRATAAGSGSPPESTLATSSAVTAGTATERSAQVAAPTERGAPTTPASASASPVASVGGVPGASTKPASLRSVRASAPAPPSAPPSVFMPSERFE